MATPFKVYHALTSTTGNKIYKTNVIGALYQKTLFAVDYFRTNANWKTVYHWFKDTLIPKLNRKCAIVMGISEDIAKRCFARVQREICARVTSFHKPRRIRKLLNRHSHRMLWLSPYSPNLNPIEKKWAEAKKLRQGWLKHNPNRLFIGLTHKNAISIDIDDWGLFVAASALLYSQPDK